MRLEVQPHFAFSSCFSLLYFYFLVLAGFPFKRGNSGIRFNHVGDFSSVSC